MQFSVIPRIIYNENDISGSGPSLGGAGSNWEHMYSNVLLCVLDEPCELHSNTRLLSAPAQMGANDPIGLRSTLIYITNLAYDSGSYKINFRVIITSHKFETERYLRKENVLKLYLFRFI